MEGDDVVDDDVTGHDRAGGVPVDSVRRAYGDGDATYLACGGEEGIRGLVESFYRIMDSVSFAERIRALHPSDLQLSTDKLVYFLCGWMGGPKLYAERFGPIKIPKAHSHLPIGEAERDAWLLCMEHALAKQPFQDELKKYLLKELFVPAERIRQVVEAGGGRGERC